MRGHHHITVLGLFPGIWIRKRTATTDPDIQGSVWRENVQKYYAYIMVDRRQISLGFYEKLEDAITVRKAGEEKYFRPRQELVNAIKSNVR